LNYTRAGAPRARADGDATPTDQGTGNLDLPHLACCGHG